eukprot:12436869-Alexandrium_andersonii.AAC.1
MSGMCSGVRASQCHGSHRTSCRRAAGDCAKPGGGPCTHSQQSVSAAAARWSAHWETLGPGARRARSLLRKRAATAGLRAR